MTVGAGADRARLASVACNRNVTLFQITLARRYNAEYEDWNTLHARQNSIQVAFNTSDMANERIIAYHGLDNLDIGP